MDDLHDITDGDLDTVVKVDSNPEFRQLSQGINKMVQGSSGCHGQDLKGH